MYGSILESAAGSVIQNTAMVISNRSACPKKESTPKILSLAGQDKRTTTLTLCILHVISSDPPSRRVRSLPDCLVICAAKAYKVGQLMDERYWVPENLDRAYLLRRDPSALEYLRETRCHPYQGRLPPMVWRGKRGVEEVRTVWRDENGDSHG